ncbi:MAG: NAD(P)-dependent oxidoreductase, partial [Acetobacterales bacterium]
ALVEALRDGTVAGAGLDVWATEPVGADNPLLQMDQVVGTSHIGGSVRDILATTARHCFRNIQAFAEGRAIPDEDFVVPPSMR